ncbi:MULTISPECIES: N-6 DNA methylase [unclassified Nocardioides]|uniref:Eco57I restriction-modification methylase domain-containing protein n=1 Tax=unclassified Nocardioides TaxID=2615069 RepID=UPI0000571545|nr:MULTISPECIES: N-6 DNA methylase [unclassified Nocardioides]ABL79356.1 putative type II DNA modification enzyme [Nocardioides sp. JS614]
MNGGLTSVRVAGALMPGDVLSAVLAGDLDGLTGSAYHLGSESPREAAARVWTHLLGVYRRFRSDLDSLPDEDPAVGLTRERWLTLLLSELGYGRVPPTPAGGLAVGDKQYPVSHLWGATPMHLLGWGVPLDKRSAGVAGAARAPHAMVQELLNRTDEYLWAVVANGRVLRLLRDSTTLTGQAYVEFDLEAMFDGELFAEFALLYLLCHQSRVEVPDDGQPADCWLERWRVTAVSQGVRAMTLLRDGVELALETLGTGFLQHPANTKLRDRLERGEIRLSDVHAALLRLAYRLLFWAVAEDRDALLSPDASQEQRRRYAEHFSSTRLRRLAVRRHGSGHDDLWQAATFVLDALGRKEGEQRLGLPGLGGLFAPTAADVLAGSRLPNAALLTAVRSLAVVQPKGQPQRLVDFAHLGAEELGSIYESLLELVPRHDPTTHAFTLETLAGNDRKTSGSYYTPTELVELVLDTALDPVLDDAEKNAHTTEEAEAALLGLRVCDPSVGSAHFLVAAARRIATRLATVRTGEVDPTPTAYSDAMHDVVARCVYGIDINPMAADLAKVSLWLTAMSPGRPLSFLDHHIKVGNALLGTTPALIHGGIPDTAYVALTGDDKSAASTLKKRNATERGQGDLFDDAGIDIDTASLRKATAEITDRAAAATTVDDVAWAAQRYADLQSDPDIIRARRVADAWCAAFLGPKTADAEPITHRALTAIADEAAPDPVVKAVDELATRHRLFHWHLEFPDVFRVPDDGLARGPYGWTGGFDAVLGNPPWERIKLQEQEFFAIREPAIAEAKNAAARKKAIAALAETDPDLFGEFNAARRQSEAESQFLRGSGRYPLCGVGDVNTYSVFAEHFRATLAPTGRSGIITPTGLATDATTAAFFADTITSGRLAAFFDFVTGPEIWSGIGHNRFRFAVSSTTGGERIPEAQLSFDNRHPRDLQIADRKYSLPSDDLVLLNPNTGTLPIFADTRDAEVTLACYRRHPILIRDGGRNPWGLRFSRLFDMANDSALFHTVEDLEDLEATFDGWAWTHADQRWLPLYEAKMLSHWNSRFSGYADVPEGYQGTALPRLTDERLDDPASEPMARYWVPEANVTKAIPEGWDRNWLFGWRDIARSSDMRTFVPSVLPRAAVGDKFLLAFAAAPSKTPFLQAVWSSLIFDYISRQKISGTGMKYFLTKQLACPEPEAFDGVPAWSQEPLGAFVRARVLELTYTSERLAAYAVDVLSGEPGTTDPGPPFRWVPERREQLRAELEAAMLCLYGLDREDAEYVLDSFVLVCKYEERDHGEFRTKRLVLAAYDAMAAAAESGVPFVSPLDPAPGEGPRHLERES